MIFDLLLVDDVKDGVSLGFQIVSEETAVTAPPNRLSTHHRHAPITREFK
jgi:hypothetical protein